MLAYILSVLFEVFYEIGLPGDDVIFDWCSEISKIANIILHRDMNEDYLSFQVIVFNIF